MRRKNWELKGIFWIITLLFVGFLAAPILLLLGKSLVGEGGFTWEFYASVVTREGFLCVYDLPGPRDGEGLLPLLGRREPV